MIRFFQSSKGRDRIPFQDSTKLVSDVLWGDAYWLETIFDRAAGGMKRTQVDALFLSLAAVGIMKLEKAKGGILRWNIGWNVDDTPMYMNPQIWIGMNLHNQTRVRKRKPLVDGGVVAVARDAVDDDDVDAVDNDDVDETIDMEISSD